MVLWRGWQSSSCVLCTSSTNIIRVHLFQSGPVNPQCTTCRDHTSQANRTLGVKCAWAQYGLPSVSTTLGCHSASNFAILQFQHFNPDPRLLFGWSSGLLWVYQFNLWIGCTMLLLGMNERENVCARWRFAFTLSNSVRFRQSAKPPALFLL